MANTGSNKIELDIEKLVERVIDLALHKVKEDITQPVALTEVNLEFNQKFLLLPVSVKIVLKEGKFWGVDTINRLNDATFTYNDPIAEVDAKFQIDLFTFNYDFQLNINKKSKKGAVKGNSVNSILSVGLQVNLEAETVQLKHLKLERSKKLRIQIDTRRFADIFANILLYVTTSFFESTLLSLIEDKVQSFIGYEIPI